MTTSLGVCCQDAIEYVNNSQTWKLSMYASAIVKTPLLVDAVAAATSLIWLGTEQLP